MLFDVYKKSFLPSIGAIDNSYLRLVPSQSVKNGVAVFQYVYEKYDPVADGNKFHSSDFDLDNIIAVGAYDMLKPVVMPSVSSMSIADSFQGLSFTETN